MRKLLTLFFVALQLSLAAINSNSQWDIGPLGSDLNGGLFAPTVGGKDVTASATLAVDGTSPWILSSSAHNFVSGDVGKYLCVTAGTYWQSGCFRINSTSSNKATVSGGIGTGGLVGLGNGFAPTWTGNANLGTYDLYSPIDYSMQNSAQVSIDNSVITATCGTNTITFTGGYVPTAADVANGVHLTATSGVTAGYYEITAFTSTTWTLTGAASACTAGPNSGVVGKMGGRLASIQTANTAALALNVLHILTGSYSHSTTTALTTGGITWEGYATNHWDYGSRPTITMTADSTPLISTSGSANVMSLNNLILTTTASIKSSGLVQLTVHGTGETWFVNSVKFSAFVKCMNADNVGADDDVSLILVQNSEFTGCTSFAIDSNTGTMAISGSYFHGNANDVNTSSGQVNGVSVTESVFVSTTTNAVFDNASSPGGMFIDHCVFISVGVAAVKMGAAQSIMSIQNSVFYNNATAINGASFATGYMSRGNAFGNNTTDISGTNVDYSQNKGFTGNPFTNSAGADFTLTKASGLRTTGWPGTTSWGATAGLTDPGAIQYVAAGGGQTSSPILK